MPVNIYSMVAPFVFLLIVVEFAYCIYKKNGFYDFQDSLSSLGTAIINQCTNVFVAYLILNFFGWLQTNLSITEIKATPLNLVLCFLGVDFLFYWFHRMNHSMNFLWAAHMPHHSTEELNYAVGLRASVTQRIASFLFYWPLVVIGFDSIIVIELVALNLVFQLIPHTRVVPKFNKFFESFMNTPSHHRVHHGLNPCYRDKNMGGFLIIWDKLFGTYAEEVEEVYYGVTRQTKTWDPTEINFQWWKYLMRDFLDAPFIWDKIRMWFMPIGWRPRGLKPLKAQPSVTIDTQVKFQSTPLQGSKVYIFCQTVLSLGVMFLVISDATPLNNLEKVLFSLLLWFSATTNAALMESKSWVYLGEKIRIILTTSALIIFAVKYDFTFNMMPMAALSLISLVWFQLKTGATTNLAKA